MGNVTFSVGGREFMLACADGEEAHVLQLGALIDQKAAASGAVGQTEARMLLFASLMLADELHELRSAQTASPTPEVSPEMPVDLAERLGKIAQRVENLADLLETDAQNA